MQTKTPTLAAIVAMARNRVIGIHNQLPWHLPADLQHFKSITTGHAILMGRKTYESIGKPLPNRLNIILTRDPHYQATGCTAVQSLEAGIQVAKQQEKEHLFIIGGADIFRQTLPFISRLYLTIIHHEFTGDTYFPVFETEAWEETNRSDHSADTLNPWSYSFLIYEKRSDI